MNSSRLLPGPLRVAIGGRIYASGDYRRTTPPQLEGLDGWKRPIVARRQRALRNRYGSADEPAGPGADALRAAIAGCRTPDPGVNRDMAPPVVLELGCGGGANAPIIAAGLPHSRYVGLDYSWAMVAGARSDRPTTPLVNGDGTALPFGDRSLRVVVDGGMLIHVPQWREAVSESCRVARDFVVLHTVTVTDAPTTVIRKRAYGFWVPEVLLNRGELVDVITSHGCDVAGTWPSIDYDLSDVLGITTRSETWLCRRRDP